jgi:hypothetical protein
MRRMHRNDMRACVLIAVLLIPLLLAAGCGESQEEQASATVCGARDDIAKHVDQLKGLTVTTGTTSQVKSGLQAIRDDLSTIRQTQDQLADDRRQEVQAANAAFADQVRELAGAVGRTISVEGATAELKSSLNQLATTYRNTFGELDCS